MSYAVINGARLWYEVRGEGEPLLLHHGYTASRVNWMPVAERLEHRYRVVLMECRGAGQSEHTPDGYTLEQYAADVVGLLDHLELERVTFAGHVGVDELANYLKDVEIGVSPYCGRDEYSGLKILDYKAAGLATIASGVAGEPELIEHGRTGWIVPPCDEQALFEAISILATNNALRRRLGQAARIEAETEHSWQSTALQLHEEFIRLTPGFPK